MAGLEKPFDSANDPTVAEIWRVPFVDGDLACHVRGSGPPILLIHSINAAASACEMADLAENLSIDHRVYNLDLPGFGRSARPAVRYDISRFVAAIDATVAGIIAREGMRTRLDAVALSLSCEFLARSASANPVLYRRLCLISPTGFQKGAHKLVEADGATMENRWLAAALENRVGALLYKGLTRPASIRFFLRQTFGGDDIDPRVYRCAIETSGEPGAEHAPLAFLTFRLFGRDITRVYQRLEIPVLLAHGRKGRFSDFSGAGWSERRENWTRKIYDTGAMPQVEATEIFAQDLRKHLSKTAGGGVSLSPAGKAAG